MSAFSAGQEVSPPAEVMAPLKGFGGFVAEAETVTAGWAIAKSADGLFVVASATKGLGPGGIADRTIEDAPAGDDTDLVNVLCGIKSLPMLSTSAFTSTDKPGPIYFHNNREFAKSNSGRSVAGLFLCLDDARPTTHAICWFGPEGWAIAKAMEQELLAASRTVRGVVCSDVADLSAFTVAGTGLTFAEGERVLLAAQSTASQCGIYVVGEVSGGTAELTRAPDMPAGARLPNDVTIEVSEGSYDGSFYAHSTWKATATTAGGWVVGTNDPAFYPKTYKQTVTLSSGTYTIGVGSTANPDEPLFLLAGASVQITMNTPAGTLGTNDYGAPGASRVTGKAGTAVVVVNSYVDAGSVAGSETSTLDVLITNW